MGRHDGQAGVPHGNQQHENKALGSIFIFGLSREKGLLKIFAASFIAMVAIGNEHGQVAKGGLGGLNCRHIGNGPNAAGDTEVICGLDGKDLPSRMFKGRDHRVFLVGIEPKNGA